MSKKRFSAVIMAAGKGKRMDSDLPKVMHQLAGRPLIDWVVDSALAAHPDKVIAIVGHGRELVMEELNGWVEFAIQEEQLGTGHAVQHAEPLLIGYDGDVLILSGDVPLLRTETIEAMFEAHVSSRNDCTVMTCIFDDASGYGRILRAGDSSVEGIVEHKDANPEQLKIKEINTGIYVVDAEKLFDSLMSIRNENAQGEYYLTDIIGDFVKRGWKVGAFIVKDPLEITGINSKEQLQALEEEFLRRNPDLKVEEQ